MRCILPYKSSDKVVIIAQQARVACSIYLLFYVCVAMGDSDTHPRFSYIIIGYGGNGAEINFDVLNCGRGEHKLLILK